MGCVKARLQFEFESCDLNLFVNQAVSDVSTILDGVTYPRRMVSCFEYKNFHNKLITQQAIIWDKSAT